MIQNAMEDRNTQSISEKIYINKKVSTDQESMTAAAQMVRMQVQALILVQVYEARRGRQMA